MKVHNTVKGISCVSGAFLINFTLGTMYTFGNMSPYIASYLKLKTNNSWVTIGHTVWILAANFIISGFLMALGGLMDKRFGSKFTCLFGSWFMSLSVILTYFSIKKSLWLVILTYGVGFGFGIGMSYSVALTAAIKWFPKRRGLVSGIVVGGFGLGSLLFSLVQTKIINPNNIPPRGFNTSHDGIDNQTFISNVSILNKVTNDTKVFEEKYFFDEEILENIPNCFVIIGVTYAFMQLIGVFLLVERKKIIVVDNNISMVTRNDTTQDDLDTSIDEEIKKSNGDHKTSLLTQIVEECQDFTVLRAIRHKMFWLLWTTFLLNGITIVTISAVYKSFGQQFISDDQYFAILGSVGGICSCTGRVFWGRLYDTINYRVIMSILTIVMAVSIGTFFLCSYITNVLAVKIIYFIYGCLLFIGHAGSFAILPSATAKCFGSTNLATIYGLIFSGLACASFLGAIISSFLFHIFQYKGQFILATIAALISCVLAQFFRIPKSMTANQ